MRVTMGVSADAVARKTDTCHPAGCVSEMSATFGWSRRSVNRGASAISGDRASIDSGRIARSTWLTTSSASPRSWEIRPSIRVAAASRNISERCTTDRRADSRRP